jgi:diaminopimelate decarboxylase
MFNKTLLQKIFANHREKRSKLPKNYWADIKIHKWRTAFLVQADTPIFLIDSSIVQDRITQLTQSLKAHFSQKARIFYSFKTNYELIKTDTLHQQQIGAEVVSGWEYNLAIKKKYSPRNIIFNGPIKATEDIVKALTAGSTVHLDTQNQINQIVSLSKQLNMSKWPGKVGVRLKTDHNSRFGYDIYNGEASEVVKRLNTRKIPLRSFHHHGGTDIYSTKYRYYHAKKITEWINNNFKNFLTQSVSLDVGGGFPAHGLYPYHHTMSTDDSTDISDHIQAISQGLASCEAIDEVVIEPGRWLIEDATMYVVKVIDVHQSRGYQRILVDGAITQLSVSYYRPQIVNLYSGTFKRKSAENMQTIIYGGTCKEDDVLFKGSLPKAVRGDIAVFFAVGAYNQSMASAFIFPLPRVCYS